MSPVSTQRRSIWVALATMASLAAIAGCGSSATPARQSGTAARTVAYRGIAIAPEDVTVHVGQKIRWHNFDATPHNITSISGVQSVASKDFGQGKTFTLTVKTVGVIHYICSIHPASMVGTITVVQ